MRRNKRIPFLSYICHPHQHTPMVLQLPTAGYPHYLPHTYLDNIMSIHVKKNKMKSENRRKFHYKIECDARFVLQTKSNYLKFIKWKVRHCPLHFSIPVMELLKMCLCFPITIILWSTLPSLPTDYRKQLYMPRKLPNQFVIQ